MNEEKSLKEAIGYWIEKGMDSLGAAEDELRAGRLSFSVNRIYYACFYAVSAVLLQKRFKFIKHSGVRAAFHKHLVKPGLVSRKNGQFMDNSMMSYLKPASGEIISSLFTFKKSRSKNGCNTQRSLLGK